MAEYFVWTKQVMKSITLFWMLCNGDRKIHFTKKQSKPSVFVLVCGLLTREDEGVQGTELSSISGWLVPLFTLYEPENGMYCIPAGSLCEERWCPSGEQLLRNVMEFLS